MPNTREPLVKGMYDLSPFTYLFRSAPFYIENCIYLTYKTSCLYKEVNGNETSTSVKVPCLNFTNGVRGREKVGQG